jgi:hypothetical protein
MTDATTLPGSPDPTAISDEAYRALDGAAVELVSIRRAGELLDAVGPRSFLHAGPPIDLEEMPGPLRAAVSCALMLEGEASTIEEAGAIIDRGEVTIRPGHDVGCVGLVAGMVSPSVPVVEVRATGGRRAFCPLHEGMAPSLRYGAYGPAVLERLRWLGEVLAPRVTAALEDNPVDIVELIQEGLRRGDEVHNRNNASSAALALRLAPGIVRTAPTALAAQIIEDLASNPNLFLSFSAPTAKAIGDTVAGLGAPRVVTAMAANGVRLGVRVGGTGDRWFTAPSTAGEPRMFEGFEVADANPAMGDSLATETVGLGAFALSGSPALAAFFGLTHAQALETSREMRQISVGISSRFKVPIESYEGTGIGIDVRKVAETGIAPIINGGFAHRTAGVGMIGVGLLRLPIEPFLEANAALDAALAPA